MIHQRKRPDKKDEEFKAYAISILAARDEMPDVLLYEAILQRLEEDILSKKAPSDPPSIDYFYIQMSSLEDRGRVEHEDRPGVAQEGNLVRYYFIANSKITAPKAKKAAPGDEVGARVPAKTLNHKHDWELVVA